MKTVVYISVSPLVFIHNLEKTAHATPYLC